MVDTSTETEDQSTLSDPSLAELNAEAEPTETQPAPDAVEAPAGEEAPLSPAPSEEAPAMDAPAPDEPAVDAPDEPAVDAPAEEAPTPDAPESVPAEEAPTAPESTDEPKEEQAGTEEDPAVGEPVIAAPETPIGIDPTTPTVTTDDVPAEGDKQEESEDAPKDDASDGSPSAEEGVIKDEQPTTAAPVGGGVVEPTKVVDGGTAPDMSTVGPNTGAVSTGEQVKVGEDHVAEGINAQSIGNALASFYCFGETFGSWLGGQGYNPWAAPALQKFAADKHGPDARLGGFRWSIVVSQFYAQG